MVEVSGESGYVVLGRVCGFLDFVCVQCAECDGGVDEEGEY